jgi:hypothetical protein
MTAPTAAQIAIGARKLMIDVIFPFLDRVVCDQSRPVRCSFSGGLMSRGVVVLCGSGRACAILGAAKGFGPRAALPVFEGGGDQDYLVSAATTCNP